MQFVKPITFAEAEAALGARHPVTSTLNSSQWGDVPEGLRTRAFFSSEVEKVRFLQRAHDFLGDFLSGARENTPGGSALKAGGRAQFVDAMAKFAEAEGMGPLNPRDKGTIKDVRSQRRLELIFDTNVQQAQDFGYWKQGQDADILEAFPAQRFIRVRTVAKPRKYHEAALGVVRLKSDLDFWLSLNPDFGLPWGPWGFNSGCDVEDVDRDEAEALGLISADATPLPVEREFNDALEASTRGLQPVMLGHLESTFGAQIVIEGDRVRWAGTGTPPAKPPAKKPPAKKPPVKPPVAPPVMPPIPAPVPPPVLVAPPSATKVSGAVLDHLLSSQKKHLATALAAIDSVHGDGPLKPTDFTHQVHEESDGTYWSTSRIALKVCVKKQTDGAAFHLCHEIGHWIDHIGIASSSKSKWASESPGIMDEWMKAVKASKAHAKIVAWPSSKYRTYSLEDYELWARSYAQFIATESGSAPLLKWLNKVRDGKTGYSKDSQWEDVDFAPIAIAIRKMFTALGWITPTVAAP